MSNEIFLLLGIIWNIICYIIYKKADRYSREKMIKDEMEFQEKINKMIAPMIEELEKRKSSKNK